MSSYELAAKPVVHPVIPVRRSLSTRWISVLTLVALLTIWWAVTATGLIEPLFLPPPSAVLQKGWLLATTGYMDSTLWQHLGASLSRIGLGLGFAVLTAVPVGIAIGSNRIARGILDPLIEFYRPIPPLAYLPLIVIWCGIGELSPSTGAFFASGLPEGVPHLWRGAMSWSLAAALSAGNSRFSSHKLALVGSPFWTMTFWTGATSVGTFWTERLWERTRLLR